MPETLGGRVRYFRIFHSPFQAQEALAQAVTRLGVRTSRFQVNEIENDKAPEPLSLMRMLAIARALGRTPEELLVKKEDYPELEFITDRATLELLQAMGWFRETASEQRKLRPVRG
jgi:transcriptional regulator with XRE-family HTH domain